MGIDSVWARTLALLLLILPTACSRETPMSADGRPPLVRVRLLQDQQRVNISGSRQATMHSAADPTPRPLQLSPQPVAVTLTGGGWRIGGAQLGGGILTLRPQVDGALAINGQPYRGEYRFVPTGPERFDVVNDVNVEDYLKGVVARELLAGWHPQAYKAQAIAARTYALYEVKTGPAGRHWDLHPDERSQVYGGVAAESAVSVAAVNATRGIVLGYGPAGQERIFKTYFSACCGGIAQSASDAFGDAWSEPLSDQNRGAVCAVSPNFNWGPVTVAKSELTRRIRAWGARRNRPEQTMGDLTRIDIQGTNRFGRPARFVVTDARGAQYSLGGEEMRMAINTDGTRQTTVNSSFFRPLNDGDAVRFIDGHGLGHGVGLCQWCTQVRAEHGQRGEDIVLSFYPRSRLVRAY